MATTTPNFGWSVPTSTDLVKDGATAIETLGDSIDASLVDLKGGTSGQILAKNSNTDMDFVWIANDQGDITAVNVTSPITGGGSAGAVTIGIDDGTTAQKGAVQLEDSTSSTSTTKAATPNSVKSAYDLANAAIPKSLVDAAGDLIYATADNTPARLAIGTAGQVLKVNSGATAPEWGAGGGGFTLINSGGTTISGNTTVSSIGGYTHLFVVIEGACRSGGSGTEFFIRFNGDSSANYAWGSVASLNSGTADSCDFNKADTEFKIGFRYGSSTNFDNGNFSSGWVYRYGSSADKVVNFDTWGTTGAPNTTPFFHHARGAYNSSSAITSILVGADETLNGGTIYVYGVN